MLLETCNRIYLVFLTVSVVELIIIVLLLAHICCIPQRAENGRHFGKEGGS